MRTYFEGRSRLKILRLILFAPLLAALVFAVGVDSKPRDKERWDNKYNEEFYIYGKEPVPFLRANVDLLPKGKALDIAMGEGRNGVFLATQGFDVLGIDISEVGLAKAHRLADENGVEIQTAIVDLENYDMQKNSYDVVLCMYFLQRDLFPQIKDSLKSGGMAVIQTYNTDYRKYANFNKKYLLDVNELLEIFKGYKIIRYEMYDDGEEAYSSIIAQKP